MPTTLTPLIDELAAFEPSTDPVVSVYLDARPDQHGRETHGVFLRKELKQRLRAFPASSPERESIERDFERIRAYLDNETRPSANGIALFACDARGLFVPLQLEVPVEDHRLYVDYEPHLYPLARLDDQYRRYAALVIDTNSARIFVFGLGQAQRKEEVQGTKTRRSSMGGWSQNRYQRHVENFHLQHVKEVVDTLDRIVTAEQIPHVVVAGDEVVVPLVREQFPARLAEKVMDVVRLDINAPDHAVLEKTLESFRQHDAEDDRQRVARLIDEYGSGGLGVLGPEDTLAALELGQVDELIVTAAADRTTPQPADAQAAIEAPEAATPVEVAAIGQTGGDATSGLSEDTAELLVTKARQTGARVVFIEDPALLANVGGVGATLRFAL